MKWRGRSAPTAKPTPTAGRARWSSALPRAVPRPRASSRARPGSGQAGPGWPGRSGWSPPEWRRRGLLAPSGSETRTGTFLLAGRSPKYRAVILARVDLVTVVPRTQASHMDKLRTSPADAISDLPDGASIAISGFGPTAGAPFSLLAALVERSAKDLCLVANTLPPDAQAVVEGRPRPAPDRLVHGARGRFVGGRGDDAERRGDLRDGPAGHARGAPAGRWRRPRGRLHPDRPGHPDRRGQGGALLQRQALPAGDGDPRRLRVHRRLPGRPPRQRGVPRRQPALRAQLRQGGTGGHRGGRRDRRAGRDPRGADRAPGHLRRPRRPQDRGQHAPQARSRAPRPRRSPHV